MAKTQAEADGFLIEMVDRVDEIRRLAAAAFKVAESVTPPDSDGALVTVISVTQEKIAALHEALDASYREMHARDMLAAA